MSALSLSISSIATKLNPNHQVLYIGCMTKVAKCITNLLGQQNSVETKFLTEK